MKHSIEDLIQRCVAGTASAEEQRVVEDWRAAGAANEAAYQRLLAALDIASSALAASDVGPPPDARKLIWLAEARSSGEQLSGKSLLTPVQRWLPLAAAAALVLAIAIPALRSGPQLPFGLDTFVAPQSDPIGFRLTDGTVIRLAPGARLRLLDEGGWRGVELEGRGFFAVAPRADQPFRVRTRAGEVLVLGTRFQLETLDSDLRVVVVDGRVALGGAGEPVEVAAGQMGMMANGIAGPVMDVPDLDPVIDWVGNFFAFQNTPLRNALDEIGRRFDLEVEIVDSRLAEQTVTAWFTDRSPSEMMRVICTVVNATCEVGADRIVVRPN